MTRHIQIDISKISSFFQVPENLTRTEEISLRKKMIHQYRNCLLGSKLNKTIKNEDIDQTKDGKPFLKNISNFEFNHSHSQHYYALVTSHHIRDLGVDIEELNRSIRFEALAKHAFHPLEYAIWAELEFDSRYWFKVWTIKEAILKAHGMGIRMSLNELNTNAHTTHMGGVCEHPVLGVFAYQNFEIMDCMLTVAWRSEYSCRGFAIPQIQITQH